MSRDIVVAAMAVIALAAGIWCWWFENHSAPAAQTPIAEEDAANSTAVKENTCAPVKK